MAEIFKAVTLGLLEMVVEGKLSLLEREVKFWLLDHSKENSGES